MMESQEFFGSLFEALPCIHDHHAPSGAVHKMLTLAAGDVVRRRFSEGSDCKSGFGAFGDLVFPYFSMGAITSIELFGLDELILFSFYQQNRNRYRTVADIGGNIGLHSVILSKSGFDVQTYEPDPVHVERLESNLKLNGCKNVEVVQAAVSDHDGDEQFIRVVGNTTGSHLAGAKEDPYGNLDYFDVKVVDIRPIIQWADFMKIDAEGHEAQMLGVTTAADWQDTDAMVEVGNEKNADMIFGHMTGIGVNMFAQKTGWTQVGDRDHMPESYKDGSLFITSKPEMCWADTTGS
jgi:FkbM family methyltransferase